MALNTQNETNNEIKLEKYRNKVNSYYNNDLIELKAMAKSFNLDDLKIKIQDRNIWCNSNIFGHIYPYLNNKNLIRPIAQYITQIHDRSSIYQDVHILDKITYNIYKGIYQLYLLDIDKYIKILKFKKDISNNEKKIYIQKYFDIYLSLSKQYKDKTKNKDLTYQQLQVKDNKGHLLTLPLSISNREITIRWLTSELGINVFNYEDFILLLCSSFLKKSIIVADVDTYLPTYKKYNSVLKIEILPTNDWIIDYFKSNHNIILLTVSKKNYYDLIIS